MSRKIRVNVGPRDPRDEDRLLRYVFANSRDGDDVEINMDRPTAGEPSAAKVDEAAERRIAETVTSKLDKLNESLDAADKETILASAEERAKEIVESAAQVKSWRKMMNEVGMKFFIELVLKVVWQERLQVWEQMKMVANNVWKSGLE